MDYYFKHDEESQNKEYSDMAKGLNAVGILALVVLTVAILLPSFF